MDRAQLEHVIAAAANVVGEDEFVVIGSQAILGAWPDAPSPLLRSMEVDIYPRRRPEKAIEIDGSLGDGSRFHQAFGYWAHGVGPETVRAPTGWEDRLVGLEIPPRPGSNRKARAFCLEPHDLVLSKCAAGREHDWQFAREAVKARIVDRATLAERINLLPIAAAERERIARFLEALATTRGPGAHRPAC